MIQSSAPCLSPSGGPESVSPLPSKAFWSLLPQLEPVLVVWSLRKKAITWVCLCVPRPQGCICEGVALGRATLWGYRGEETRALEAV